MVTVTDTAAAPSKTANSSATTVNHTSGGIPVNEQSVKTTTPASDPSRSRRYASSRGRCVKQSATSSPGPAMIAATERNTIGSVTQIGGPEVARLVKKMTELLDRSTVTG